MALAQKSYTTRPGRPSRARRVLLNSLTGISGRAQPTGRRNTF